MDRHALNLFVILVLVSVVVLIAATAPPSSYAHAQNYQMDCVLSAAQDGHWLLPRSQTRGLDRKPPLYVWLDAPVLKWTGVCNDFTYRLPNIAAFSTLAVLIYYLGRRWYGPRAGLLAACLWVTSLHMGKLSYMALTDMLFAVLFAGSIACADRLLFHRAPPGVRWRWGVGLWATMTLGALAKGWGLVNMPLFAAFIALAAGSGAGFRAPAGTRWSQRIRWITLLLIRRWRRAARRLYLGWGLLAMVLVLAPILVPMWHFGGAEFRRVVDFEVVQRFSGSGGRPPASHSMPPPLVLLYYQLPVTLFAVAAMLLVRPRRWIVGRSPLRLPLCWIVAVVLPFCLSKGFRPDYLAPCYAGLALLAGWGIDHLARIGAQAGRASVARHIMGAAAVGGAAMLVLLPLNLAIHPYLPHEMREVIHVPEQMPAVSRAIALSLPLAGAVLLWAAIRASLRWRIPIVAGLTVLAMIGILFLDRHVHSRHATDRDGQAMKDFADMIRPIIKGDSYAICQAENACVPIYLGRFGQRIAPADAEADLNATNCRWLVISDKGLAAAGAARIDPNGTYTYRIRRRQYRFTTQPDQFGIVRAVNSHDIEAYEFGRLFLVELRRPVHLEGKPPDQSLLPAPDEEED